jgi:hypothetical protein
MITLTKKRSLIIATVTVVVVLAFAIPLAAYALPVSDSNIASSRTLVARGVAREVVNGENVTVPANFTLTLARAGGNNTVPRFNVVGGTVVVNGAVYTIDSGNGGVLRGRHLILLKAQGTGPDGQAVTLKLAGRYFWMGGRLYVARIGARLLTLNGNYTLLLRAQIRV